MLDSNLQVGFLVNGSPVGCGGTFSERDILTFEHNLDGDYLVDVEGAVFSTPNAGFCNTRMFSTQGNKLILLVSAFSVF